MYFSSCRSKRMLAIYSQPALAADNCFQVIGVAKVACLNSFEKDFLTALLSASICLLLRSNIIGLMFGNKSILNCWFDILQECCAPKITSIPSLLNESDLRPELSTSFILVWHCMKSNQFGSLSAQKAYVSQWLYIINLPFRSFFHLEMGGCCSNAANSHQSV